MDYKVDRKEKPNNELYHKTDVDIAYDFSKKAYKEFGTFLRAIVLFGSTTKNETKEDKDIDILLIVDDVEIYLTPEIIETYRVIVQKLASQVSNRLHITTLRFTSFWDLSRNGDPVIINTLREGMVIIDSGFFEPLQILLRQGRIKPTEESIWTYFSRSPTTLYNAKMHILQATTNLYWAVVDAAHAALMHAGEMPPSPEHLSDLLQVRLVNEGKIHKRYAATMKKFYELFKGITHRKIKEISGKEYDEYYKEAEDFVKKMRELISGRK